MSDVPDLDYSAIFSVLTEEERSAVRYWEQLYGIPEGSWPAAPSLRTTVVTAAVQRLADDMPELSRSDARAEAAATFGLDDDPYRKTRPSDRIGRRLRDWRDRAGEFLRTRETAGG